ncbi:hypothetical protein PUNSTDRAFT_130090 [Punctularia strigosozonata HHB-11173 SS5]|uniref:uncharacterized protein n=1 Tax=Punctularia strigosozonata (strain HHB-11173) TaxID=741275 RepID=UPI0004416712|nr:uncharacterized protein PUNSTDRAFT_130090 [Punctularia strigosozonata HHB-11173 SS5]EIN14461.1 hypothetical protein PUNSTDRAFT_130090 [Punctularia strigosozonata HHB-11173 SS5]
MLNWIQRNWSSDARLGAAAVGTVVALYFLSSQLGSRARIVSLGHEEIIHIVLFKFKPSVSRTEQEYLSQTLISFRDDCKLPDGSRYIISVDGGRNNSPEAAVTRGLTHGYVLKFKSKADRDYYAHEDPVHKAFKDRVKDSAEDVVVFDYEAGEFIRSSIIKSVA